MANKKDSAKDEVIYDSVTFRPMHDVSHEPNEQKLVTMRKLEQALRFVLDNLEGPSTTPEDAAKHAGYSPSYFKLLFSEHFEMPFAQFVMKLRMRSAALTIRNEHYPKNIPARYGFANAASFSKAFRREIGISPRQFYKGNYTVPDMPLRKKLNGVPITLEYTIERAFSICGPTAPPPQGADTYLMDTLALPFTGAYPQFAVSGTDQVGLWHYDPKAGLEYVFGQVEERFNSISLLDAQSEKAGGKLRVVVQGGRYAVFSYQRPADNREIPLMQRILSRFIFQEWVPMNRKVTNTMGFTYERFTPERVFFYLPVQKGMDNGSELQAQRWGLADWARHIDELIGIDLTADALAELEGYSTKSYVDIFSMYYGMTPSAYIRKRRLHLAAQELRENEGARREETLKKYRFSSYEQYCRIYQQEFGEAGAPGDGGSAKMSEEWADIVPDLEEFYESSKEKVSCSVRRVQEFEALGHSVEESRTDKHPDDVVGRALYWFQHEFPGFEQLTPCFEASGAKVFVWTEDASEDESDDSGALNRYIVARVLRRDLGPEQQARVERACEQRGARRGSISGGCYAVFSTLDNLESFSLEDAFSLLTRTAFGGWIQDNRWRVDFSRRTFVEWRDCRLYFFVPVVG